MKRALVTGMTVLLATISIAASCTRQQPSFKAIDPEAIIAALEEIDSMVGALKGYEPKDENYTQPDVPFSENINQQAYDSAKVVWNEFVKMCRVGEYRKAYSYFLAREGDFLICLKHSSARYHFDSLVLLPLMAEFETEDDAADKYIDVLKLEFALESATMSLAEGGSGYIPETLPSVITDLGMLLSASGRIDEALDMVDVFAYAVNGLTGNPILTSASVAYAVADFFQSAGDYENELATLADYVGYAKEHIDAENEEEYMYYICKVEERISGIGAERKWN